MLVYAFLLISKQVKHLYKWTSIRWWEWNLYNEEWTHTVRTQKKNEDHKIIYTSHHSNRFVSCIHFKVSYIIFLFSVKSNSKCKLIYPGQVIYTGTRRWRFTYKRPKQHLQDKTDEAYWSQQKLFLISESFSCVITFSVLCGSSNRQTSPYWSCRNTSNCLSIHSL